MEPLRRRPGPTPPAEPPRAVEPKLQSHVSNWERDLVEARSRERQAGLAAQAGRGYLTLGATAIGLGLMFAGMPYAAVAVWLGGIVVAPPYNPPPPRP